MFACLFMQSFVVPRAVATSDEGCYRGLRGRWILNEGSEGFMEVTSAGCEVIEACYGCILT